MIILISDKKEYLFQNVHILYFQAFDVNVSNEADNIPLFIVQA